MEELRVPGARPVSKRSWNSRFWLDHIPNLGEASTTMRYSSEMLASREKVRGLLIKSRKLNKNRKTETTRAASSSSNALPRAYSELRQVWEEGQIAKENQELFFAVMEGLPEGKAASVIEFEARQSIKRSSLLMQIGRAVAQREEGLSLLHYLCEFFDQTPGLLSHRSEALKCVDAISRMRLVSLQVVEGIEKWKAYLSSLLALQSDPPSKHLAYAWEGFNYLEKMKSDLDFLVHSSISRAFQFAESDPFLLICSTCGSVPEAERTRGLIFYPSDTGKLLVPASASILSRIRLSEIVVLEEESRVRQVHTSHSSPRSPIRGSFSVNAARSASVSAPLPASMQADPKLAIELVFEVLLNQIISKELKSIATDAISVYRIESNRAISKAIAEKYTEQIIRESVKAAVVVVFSEVSKAKLVLHSSNILDDIVLQAISEEIPRIARAAVKEEVAHANAVIAERVFCELLTLQIRQAISDAVTGIISEQVFSGLFEQLTEFHIAESCAEEIQAARAALANSVYEDLASELLLEIAAKELTDFEVKQEKGEVEENDEKKAEELLESPLQVEMQSEGNEGEEHSSSEGSPPSKSSEKQEPESAPAFSEQYIPTSEEIPPEATSRSEVSSVDYEESVREQDGAELHSIAFELAKHFLAKMLDGFDCYELAEEVCFNELSESSLPHGQKVAILEKLRSERVVRLLFNSLLDSLTSEPWLFDLCSQQLHSAETQATASSLLVNDSKQPAEERIDYVMEAFTPSVHSPRTYTPGSAQLVAETQHSEAESALPEFPSLSKLELLFVFASSVEMEPVEVYEDDLLPVLRKYMGLIDQPLNSCLTNPEALLQVMHGAINPQWYWMIVEGKIVGLACFRDEQDRVVCEHFSCLDFRYSGYCFDEITRWALMQYQEVRIRIYYRTQPPSEFKEFLTAKEMRWKTVAVSQGVECMEVGKCREEPLAPRPMGVRFECGAAEQDSGPIAARIDVEGSESELVNLRFASEGKVHIALRVPGSECRLEVLEGRLCKCLRVRPEVMPMQFASRRVHPRGFSTFIVQTSDKSISLFLLQAKDSLPPLPLVSQLLRESEAIPESQSDLWFPNFLLRGRVAQYSVTLTCAQEEPTATVKVRSRTGVVVMSDFLVGKTHAGLILASTDTVLIAAAVEMKDWDRVV